MTSTSAILAQGRLLCDLKPKPTPFGVLYEWTIEDLDSEDLTVVASGLAATPDIAALEVNTAALLEVRLSNMQATNPVLAGMLRETPS